MKLKSLFVLLYCFLRDNCRKGDRQITKCRCIWGIQGNFHRILIHCIDRIDKVYDIRYCCRFNCPVQRKLHILCCHLGTIMKFYILAKFKSITGIRSLLPAFCQRGFQYTGLRIYHGQCIKDMLGYLNSRCFFPLMRIQ